MSKRLVDHTTAELLKELLNRYPPQPGPYRVQWSEAVNVVTLPVGKDHAVSMYLSDDEIKAVEEELQK